MLKTAKELMRVVRSKAEGTIAARTPTIRSFAILSTVALLVNGAAQADTTKPKQTPDRPTETATLNFTKVEFSYQVDGAPGPSVTLEGVLHLGSKVLFDDGVPIGFRLHGNLSNASGLSADGTTSFVAAGASEAIPTECEPEACAPPFWTFTFRLIPQGSGLRSSLLFDLTVSTQYDADGKLLNACILGEEGCDVGVVP